MSFPIGSTPPHQQPIRPMPQWSIDLKDYNQILEFAPRIPHYPQTNYSEVGQAAIDALEKLKQDPGLPSSLTPKSIDDAIEFIQKNISTAQDYAQFSLAREKLFSFFPPS